MSGNKPTFVNGEQQIGKDQKQKDADLGPTFRTTWWSRRTFLEKGLFVLLLLSFLVIIIIVIIAATRSSLNSSTDNGMRTAAQHGEEICMSPDCVKTASRILESMDPTVDPCDDFFEYACGTWNRKNVIPDDRPTYNTFSKLRDDLDVVLKALLEKPILDTEPQAIANSKHLYQSCLNLSQIETRGDQPLRHLITTMGGWPVLDPQWDEENFDYVELMAQLRLLNNWVLVNMWVSPDDKDSSVNIIQIDQAQLGMPSRDYYLGDRQEKALVAYETFAIEIAKLLGATPEDAEEQMRLMVDFEIELANMTMPEEDRRNTEKLYHRYKVSELATNITSYIDWPRYINTVFHNVSIVVGEDEDVVVYAPEYLQQLAELLKRTTPRTLANNMVWMVVQSVLASDPLPARYISKQQKYRKALIGTETDRARWRTCVKYVNDNFGMAVGRMFVQENFDEQAKANAISMISDIRVSFNELLEKVTWMDEKTRQVAREKADAIQEKIGYPDYIRNNSALDLDYDGIVMEPSKYFENVLTNLNALTRYRIKILRDAVDKTAWSTFPAVVNAFYSPTKNQIMFPAGILQPPFYHASYPKSMNFGGIAMVIGHEITHGFDDKGRQFDKDGNLIQWWSDSVIERFKERAQCIIDQYANYTVPEVGLNLNGKLTQGENIADNGGLKQSFTAYRNWVDHRGYEEPALPGLNLSHNQLFFLNFAQIWCGSSRPESYLQYVRSGRHSPGRFRVIGSVSNSDSFAEAFSCPRGSRMNPTNKCQVW